LCPCHLVPLRLLHPWVPHPLNNVSRRPPQLHPDNRRPPHGEQGQHARDGDPPRLQPAHVSGSPPPRTRLPLIATTTPPQNSSLLPSRFPTLARASSGSSLAQGGLRRVGALPAATGAPGLLLGVDTCNWVFRLLGAGAGHDSMARRGGREVAMLNPPSGAFSSLPVEGSA
jgi:hypothetical protein